MKFLMTMMIHQLSVTSNKVSSQLISPQNWPVFIFPLTQSEPDIYHLNSNQSLKKFPVVLTCTYFSFYLSCGPRGIFYYLESITWSFHNHMCLLHYSRLNSSHSKDRCENILRILLKQDTALLSHVSQSVSVSVTGVTSQVFSIIWLFRPWKPYALTNLITRTTLNTQVTLTTWTT